MREDPEWVEGISIGSQGQVTSQDIFDMVDAIERGFYDIERRIGNMDLEHSKYVRATVMRLNYLLNQDDSMKGLMIQLVNEVSRSKDMEESLSKVSRQMNLASLQVLSPQLFYKKRPKKFEPLVEMEPVEEQELSEEEVLRLNRITQRYSKKQVQDYIEQFVVAGKAVMSEESVKTMEDFEKLILAYD